MKISDNFVENTTKQINDMCDSNELLETYNSNKIGEFTNSNKIGEFTVGVDSNGNPIVRKKENVDG